jgi:hypothetical protein
MPGSQNIGDDCCCTLAIVERHQQVPGIGQELARQVDIRWVGVGLIDRAVDIPNWECYHWHFDHPREQQLLWHVLRPLYVGSLPPSYVPSTPFEFL